MAHIAIRNGTKNLIFAALVANATGAHFYEEGNVIVIEDYPLLTIPRYCFDDAHDPENERPDAVVAAWRTLLDNRDGNLLYFGDDEIVLTDDSVEPLSDEEIIRRRKDYQRFEDA